MNLNIRVSLNSGAALILWAIGVFGMIVGSSLSPAVERIFPVALSGWTAGVTAFWVKRNANNKLASKGEQK